MCPATAPRLCGLAWRADGVQTRGSSLSALAEVDVGLYFAALQLREKRSVLYWVVDCIAERARAPAVAVGVRDLLRRERGTARALV